MPSHAGLVNEATKLNKDAKDLRTKATDAAGNLSFELDAARRLEADAEQVNRPHRDDLSRIRVTNCWTKSQ